MHIRSLGLNPLSGTLIPGIKMEGTMPIFYKILVTTELVRAVQLRKYPTQSAIVHAHLPEVLRPVRRYSESMKPLDNRDIILSCYESFRWVIGVFHPGFVGHHFCRYFDGH